MIGYIIFTLHGEETKAVLEDNGKWTVPDSIVEGTLNISCNPDEYGPAVGYPKLYVMQEAVKLLNGKLTVVDPKLRKAQKPPTKDDKGLILY